MIRRVRCEMNIKSRLKKIERQTGVNSKFCRCGTPYIVTFVIGGENIINNVCPECGRDVRPRTGAGIVIDANRNQYSVLEPKVEFTRQEFEDWQNDHVISAHISYEEYLNQNK